MFLKNLLNNFFKRSFLITFSIPIFYLLILYELEEKIKSSFFKFKKAKNFFFRFLKKSIKYFCFFLIKFFSPIVILILLFNSTVYLLFKIFRFIKNYFRKPIKNSIQLHVKKPKMSSIKNQNFDKLDNFTLLNIFSNLDLNDLIILRRCCFRWKLIMNSILKTIEKLSITCSKNPTKEFFKTCHNQEHNTNNLELLKAKKFHEISIINFLRYTNQLKVLNLNNININEHFFICLTDLQILGTSLEHIDISNCHFECFYNAKKSFEEFFNQAGKSLKHFSFIGNTGFILPLKKLVYFLKKYCPVLESLALDYQQYSDKITELFDLEKQLISLHLHGLNDNNLNFNKKCVSFFFNNSIEYLNLRCLSLDNTILKEKIDLCKNLKVLKFFFYTETLINDENNLANIFREMEYLESLSIMVCCNLNLDDFFISLIFDNKLSSLNKLSIKNYSLRQKTIKEILDNFPNLIKFKLNDLKKCSRTLHYHNYKPEKIEFDNLSLLKKFTEMKKLNKLSLNYFDINDDGLDILLDRSSNVSTLSFTNTNSGNRNWYDKFLDYSKNRIDKSIKFRVDKNLYKRISKKPLINDSNKEIICLGYLDLKYSYTVNQKPKLFF